MWGSQCPRIFRYSGFVLLAGMLVCAALLHAQTNAGSLYGRVSDAQGRAVAGAIITVRSTDLASARTAVADAGGRFELAGLVPGAYTVEARAGELLLRHAVRLNIGLGSSTQVDVRLDVATLRQTARVRARGATSEGNTVAPPINRSEPSVSNFFPGIVVTYLPNRDRDISQFAQLSANAHESSDGDGVIVDGQRATALVTEVDGADLSSPLFGGVQDAENRSFLLPQTVIREFQMVSSGAAADVDRTNAGLVNVATKEGSNKFHGEAFYTGRPATLSSADAFGHSLDNFQSTYGGSFGGPVRKDRSFFYAGYEQDFLHLPTYAEFAPQASNLSIPGTLSAMQGQIVEHNTPLALFGRLDQVLNAANTLNLELAGNRIRASNLGDGLSRSLAVQSNSSSLGGQSIFGRAGLATVLDARTINQALIAWSSDHRATTPNSTAPEMFVNGFGILGGDALGPHLYTSQHLQLADSLSISRGPSLFTLGASFHHQPAYEEREENLNGRFDYNSLADYLNNHPRRFQQTFIIGDTRYRGTIHELGLSANARLELRRDLTLTAGLRWDAQWNPQPPSPNPAITQTQKIPNDLLQWQPRLGLAWNPLAKTVVRLSSGIYAAPTPATFFHRVIADNGLETVAADSYFDPQLLALTDAFSPSPHALPAVPAGLSTPSALVEGIAPGFRNPDSFQASASVDQELLPKLTLRSGYLYASTWNLQQAIDENLYAPTFNEAGVPVFPTVRPIAGVGRLLVNQPTAHSSYDSLTVSAISQISRRSQLTANYTLSQTHDNNSNLGPYGIASTLNPFDPAADKSYSNLDIRHVFNVNAIFNLPVGFKLNPLLLAHSAPPYTGIVGFDTQNDANDFNDRAIVNGKETTRNSFREPAFADLDLRVVKDFTLKGEGHHLDLFMDVFNLLGASNRNFGSEQVSFYGTPAAPVYSAGQALFAPGASRIGGPWEIQFTARLVAF